MNWSRNPLSELYRTGISRTCHLVVRTVLAVRLAQEQPGDVAVAVGGEGGQGGRTEPETSRY